MCLYICKAKIGKDSVGFDEFRSFLVTDLIDFTHYLDEHHKSWTWFDVLDRDNQTVLESYSTNIRPMSKSLDKCKDSCFGADLTKDLNLN